MRDKDNCAAKLTDILHFIEALPLKRRVPHCQNLINDQNLRLQVSSNRKSKAKIHPTGIMLDRCIEEPVNLSKSYDLVELAGDLSLLHAQDGPIKVNILSSG